MIEQNLDNQVKEQSRLIEEDMPQLKENYTGRIVIYYNHKVLVVGDDELEVLNQLTEEQKSLPFIVERIGEPEDFMGGPIRD